MGKTKFQQLGFFLPDEIADILIANNSQILLKSKFTVEYKVVDYFGKGGDKMLTAAHKFIDLKSFCKSKI